MMINVMTHVRWGTHIKNNLRFRINYNNVRCLLIWVSKNNGKDTLQNISKLSILLLLILLSYISTAQDQWQKRLKYKSVDLRVKARTKTPEIGHSNITSCDYAHFWRGTARHNSTVTSPCNSFWTVNTNAAQWCIDDSQLDINCRSYFLYCAARLLWPKYVEKIHSVSCNHLRLSWTCLKMTKRM